MSRKFRWSFEAEFPFGRVESSFVKIAARPPLTEADAVKEFTTTYFDLKPNNDPVAVSLFKVLGEFYKFGAEMFQTAGDKALHEHLESIGIKLGTGTLTLLLPTAAKCPNCNHVLGLFDRSGPMEPLERWKVTQMWPHSINFGELCYSSSDEVEIEVTWRYKEAIYEYLGPKYDFFGQTAVPVVENPNIDVKNMGLGKMGDNCCKCDKPQP